MYYYEMGPDQLIIFETDTYNFEKIITIVMYPQNSKGDRTVSQTDIIMV